METFLEIFLTSVITFIAGFLAVRYKPKPKRRPRFGQPLKPKQETTIRSVYRNYSAKFILVFLVGILLFSGIFYLMGNGYIIVKW